MTRTLASLVAAAALVFSFSTHATVVTMNDPTLAACPFTAGDPLDIGKLAEHFEVDMCEEAQAIAREGRGGLIISAHIGNWEAYPLLLARQGFHPVYAIGKPPKNRPFSRYLQARRERLGVRQLSRHGAMKDAPKVVQAGGLVGLILDQRAFWVFLLLYLVLRGAGPLSLDAILSRRQRPQLSAA